MMTNIFVQQLKILKKIQRFFFSEIKQNQELSIYDYYYFTSWVQNYGNWSLRSLIKKNTFLSNFKFIIKYIIEYSIKDTTEFSILEKISKNNYKNLIITYMNSSNLKKNKLYDTYFNTKIHNSTKTLWLIINFDYINVNLNKYKNVLIINKKFTFFNIKFYFFLFKNFFLILFKKKKIKDKVFYNFLEKTLLRIVKYKCVNNVYLPYESQPHQHFIIKIIKKYSKKIRIFGFLHSSLVPLPTDFFYKKNYEPDKLIVNGEIQKKILHKYLLWPKSRVAVKNSFRYLKKNKSTFYNKIYLSYFIGNPDAAFNKIKYLLKTILNFKNKFNVINHPYMANSFSHNKLLNLLGNYNRSRKNLIKKNITIVVGVSAIILEILENDQEVIHICEDPIFESHTEEI